MEQADKIKKDTEVEKQHLGEEEKVFNAEKLKVDNRIKAIDDRLNQLDAQRKQIIPDIDPKILSQYDRILASRDGLAIVGVKNNSCLGCNMFVPPQVINLIRMYDKIITCEICNRILYVENGQD
jgi:predicted  nucleic acid-binding Zn-ribbon protein